MIENAVYQEDLYEINKIGVQWEQLRRKSVLITGAAGLIGSVLADTMIYRNEHYSAGMELWFLGRNEHQFRSRYKEYFSKEYCHFLIQDVSCPIHIEGTVDYIIHAASKGDPDSFRNDPVGVMNANYQGMYQVLELAREKQSVRVLYISSGEVYGIVKSDHIGGLIEKDYGYLDILLPRSCYSSSKRAAETLCISYAEQFGVNVVIARLCHTYGPSMQDTDSRVISEFIHSALQKKDIVMKSQGLQKRSYCYVADAVSALMFILLKGNHCEAYNVANKDGSITIYELAELVARLAGTKVIGETLSQIESKNSSHILHAILNPAKLENLGWKPYYGVHEGVERTMRILKDIMS